MKREKGQISLIMVIASLAAISIIIATTTNTTSSTRTLSVIKNSQKSYEEALFINDYICGKFQEYVGKDNDKLSNIFGKSSACPNENNQNGSNFYKSKIKDFFNEAVNIIQNKCNLNAKDIVAPQTITVNEYRGIAGYYDHWFYDIYNCTKIIRYNYNFKIDGKYRNATLEIGILKVKGNNNQYYFLSYATSSLKNPGGM